VTPWAARFKPLRLLSLNATALREIMVTRGGDVERVERVVRGDDGAWRVQAPERIDADRVITAEAERLLSSLEAARFVADAAESAHGFGHPWAVVRTKFAAKGESVEFTLPATAPNEHAGVVRVDFEGEL
jgi:hypothetical protein